MHVYYHILQLAHPNLNLTIKISTDVTDITGQSKRPKTQIQQKNV